VNQPPLPASAVPLPIYRSDPQLDVSVKNGASWFYWIAAMSLVNSVLLVMGSNVSFVVGLGITQFVAVIAREAQNQGDLAIEASIIAFMITAAAAGFFIVMGIFANKRHIWAFIIGMLVYALDGMLLLLEQDLFSLAFHGFALFCLFGGLRAAIKLNAAEQQTRLGPSPDAAPPANNSW
jgi:hypothetical protein